MPFSLKWRRSIDLSMIGVVLNRADRNREHMYDLNPHQSKTRLPGRVEPSTISVMISKPCTLILFYGSPIIIGVEVIVFKALCVF